MITLDAPTKEALAGDYVRIALLLAKKSNIRSSDILVSSNALSGALNEAAKDIEIITARRQKNYQITNGKVAGVVAFRLARFAPLHLSGSAIENDKALKLNELVALVLALKNICNINISDIQPQSVTEELQYNLVRRHTNQETLGLVFEVLVSSVSARKQVSS